MQISLIQAREHFMWNGIKEPLIRGKTGRKEVMILLFIAETLGENYYVLDTVLGLENTKTYPCPTGRVTIKGDIAITEIQVL